MIEPHIIKNSEIQRVNAWVVCGKCNNARHRIMPGEFTPWWFCQDEKYELAQGQEIEVEYIDDQYY